MTVYRDNVFYYREIFKLGSFSENFILALYLQMNSSCFVTFRGC